MGANLQGPDDDRSSDRSVGSPQYDSRAERNQREVGGSESKSTEATTSGRSHAVIAYWKNEQFQWGNLVVAKAEM